MTVSDYQSLGEWVKHRREALRLTQKELGSMLGYQEDTIYKYEKDDRFPRRLAPALAEALNIPAAYMDDFLAVAQGKKNVSSLPPAHSLSEITLADQRKQNAFGIGDVKWVTVETTSLLFAERAGSLIGRDEQIDRIHALLDANTPVLINGFGGIGKTALAAETAYQRLGRGEGDVLWLHVGGTGLQGSLLRLAEPLGMEREVTRASSVGDAAYLIQERLAGERLALLVLDNVWWSYQDFSWFINHIVPPHLPLLITARNRYALRGGDVIVLDDLASDDGLAVVAHHAGVRVEALAGDPAARALCASLGNLPLALEIAGNNLALNGIPPAKLLARIEKAISQLRLPADYTESETATRRYTSVSAAISVSLEQLTNGLDRKAFYAFGSLFVPTATQAMIALLLDMEPDDERAVSALDELRRRSLVRPVEIVPGVESYRVHDVAFRYLREQIGVSKPNQQRIIAASARYAREFVQDINALHAEHFNLLQAAALANDEFRQPEALVDMLHLFTVESPYLSVHGHDDLLREQLYAAIHAAEALEATHPDYPTKLHYLYSKLGNIENSAGRIREAQAAYENALERARQLGIGQREIILLGTLSRILVDQEHFEAAAEILMDMREKANQLDDGALLQALQYEGYYHGIYVNTLKQRGDTAPLSTVLARARETWEQYQRLATKLGITRYQLTALLNLGAVAEDEENYDEAIYHLTCLIDHRRTESDGGVHLDLEGVALKALGSIAHKRAMPQDAQRYMTTARAIFKQLGKDVLLREITAYMVQNGYAVEE